MYNWPKDTPNWDTFRLIGDAVRGEYRLSKDFSQRVTQPLAQEPIVLAPRHSAVKRITNYALSVAASLPAIALVGGIAFFNNPLTPQEFSPSTAILGFAPYLRSVSGAEPVQGCQ